MSEDAMFNDPSRRHDFVLLFDVADGNPNGDPDAGNLPRVDPETMQGLVTDVCIKRKVRNFVGMAKGDAEPYKIYVNDQGVALNTLHQEAYAELGLKPIGHKQKRDDIKAARAHMCKLFYDVRMFGAVMTTGDKTTGANCGQVRGPLQLTFARSIEPVIPMDVSITRVSITRVAITKPEDAGAVEGDAEGKNKVTEMGRKALVPYGLYAMHGFFSVPFAEQTCVTADDLALFWDALQRMWDLDHSAARGMMACRGLYVFTHADRLGNAPAQTLFERVKVAAKTPGKAARAFNDYSVAVDDAGLPEGVSLARIVG